MCLDISFLASGAVLAGYGTYGTFEAGSMAEVTRNWPLKLQSAPLLPGRMLWFLLEYQDVPSCLIFLLPELGADTVTVFHM